MIARFRVQEVMDLEAQAVLVHVVPDLEVLGVVRKLEVALLQPCDGSENIINGNII
jgi:hypothetical protein